MIEVTGGLSIDQIAAIADCRDTAVVPQHVLDRLAEGHTAAGVLASRVPVYGRSTGVGANKDTAIRDGDQHARRLLRSHAVDAGNRVSDRAVRAMLGVRLGQLARGGSGIEPTVVIHLARMLADDSLPIVRELGSIGTGDLTALAGTALTLLGERPATRPLEPMPGWGAESALAFISSSALTIGRAALAVTELRELDRVAILVCALSFHGLDGNPQAYSAAAAAASASAGVDDAAARLRAYIGDTTQPARIQDPYALRIAGIVQGVVVTATERLAVQVSALADSAQENPLHVQFSGASDPGVAHHGAFYQAALTAELDAVALALAQTSTVTLSRLRLLNEPSFTGLPAFLADGEPGASGLMMVEYVAAAAVAEVRAAAQPAALGTVILSRGAEEDAPFAAQAMVQLERSIAATRTLVACELLGAVRVLSRRGIADRLPSELSTALTRVTAVLGEDITDRDLRPDLDLATALLAEL
jgi:histidine ammonia-lyase